MLAGQLLQFVRLTVPAAHVTAPWQEQLQKRAFVPQHLAGLGGTTVYGLTSQRVALELINMQFGVELLGPPDLPQATDLFLLRDDLARQTGFLVPVGDATPVFASAGAKRLVLSATADGVVVAIPPDVDHGVDAFHFDSARQGHTLKLTPDPLLWDTAPPPAELAAAALGPQTLPPEVAAEFARIDAAAVTQTVGRYSGQRALDGSEGGTRVKSRHILEEGNARVVDQLVADLDVAGQGRLQVRRHPFSHAGRTLQNVEAELVGTSPELVLVTAHLDSTAGSEPGYNPRNDPAPGADDDASGVAGVLAVAERFANLAAAGTLTRTVRFVLFNAEEQGLIGSRAYARRSKARGEVIAAVWQMDMIGFNRDAPQKWELHAGFEAAAAVETCPSWPARRAGPAGRPNPSTATVAPLQRPGWRPGVWSERPRFVPGPRVPSVPVV